VSRCTRLAFSFFVSKGVRGAQLPACVNPLRRHRGGISCGYVLGRRGARSGLPAAPLTAEPTDAFTRPVRVLNMSPSMSLYLAGASAPRRPACVRINPSEPEARELAPGPRLLAGLLDEPRPRRCLLFARLQPSQRLGRPSALLSLARVGSSRLWGAAALPFSIALSRRGEAWSHGAAASLISYVGSVRFLFSFRRALAVACAPSSGAALQPLFIMMHALLL